MKYTTRRKVIAITTAAVVGCFISGLATFLVFCTQSGYYLYVRFLFGWPAYALSVAMGLNSDYFASDAAITAYFVVVNCVLGALLGGFVGYIWQLIVNKNS